MPFGTFDELVTEIADYLARGDLDANIPTFIRLCEVKFNRRIRLAGNETTAVLTPVNGAVALPADYAEWRTVSDVSTGRPLAYVTPSVQAEDAHWSGGSHGRSFTIIGSSLLISPTAAGPVSLVYYRGVTPLVAGASNWLLDRHPDLYLYMALAEAEVFLKNDARITLWKSMADGVFSDMVEADRSARWGRAAVRAPWPTP